jgi:hypothetical protein
MFETGYQLPRHGILNATAEAKPSLVGLQG